MSKQCRGSQRNVKAYFDLCFSHPKFCHAGVCFVDVLFFFQPRLTQFIYSETLHVTGLIPWPIISTSGTLPRTVADPGSSASDSTEVKHPSVPTRASKTCTTCIAIILLLYIYTEAALTLHDSMSCAARVRFDRALIMAVASLRLIYGMCIFISIRRAHCRAAGRAQLRDYNQRSRPLHGHSPSCSHKIIRYSRRFLATRTENSNIWSSSTRTR